MAIPQEETAYALATFEAYCSLGADRSLVKLREHLRQTGTKRVPSLTTLKDWSRAFKWQERVKKYEIEEAEREHKSRLQEVKAMNKRHALLAVNAQKQMVEQIRRLIAARKFGSQATVALLKLATDLERLARGEATQQSKVEIAGDAERPLAIKTIWDRALLKEPQGDEEEPAALEQGEEDND